MSSSKLLAHSSEVYEQPGIVLTPNYPRVPFLQSDKKMGEKMGFPFTLASLVRAPEINPINRKARAVPFLNPVNLYGRVFFFAWFGFMVAFWAWYAFPPLLTRTIKKDLNLSTAQVANSNIVSLCATLIIRVVAGPLCDQFGPRKVLAGCLLLGALPIGFAPLVQTANGLYASRFFIGILGGSFVPCLVWTTGFFDKNVVGTANAFAGGWGNAGGGITYFIMPAVFDSFVARRHAEDQAWRLTFIVPLIMLLGTGILMLLLCPDTPVGPWRERKIRVQENLHLYGMGEGTIVAVSGGTTEDRRLGSTNGRFDGRGSTKKDMGEGDVPGRKLEGNGRSNHVVRHEVRLSPDEALQAAQDEMIAEPSPREMVAVFLSLPTWTVMVCYACSFGGELAINSILSSYYLKNFADLGQTKASNWAAMFGFLNFVTRPLGGVVADLLYQYGKSNQLWLKKGWMHTCGVLAGVALIVIGKTDSHDLATFNGLLVLMAVFLEAGNGANFALVPHVHPHANGVVSGFTGAFGNLGGVVFAVLFRFMDEGRDYARAFWVMGCIHVGLNVVTGWIRPIPKWPVGGRYKGT